MTTLSEVLTVREAAQRLGVSEARVRQFCAEARVGRKVGNQWLLIADELRQFAKLPRKPGRPSRNS